MAERAFHVGVDIGGTKIAGVACDDRGAILSQVRDRTHSPTRGDLSVPRIADLVRETVASAGLPMDAVRAVGVCAPGPLDVASGTVIRVPVLKWTNVPVRALLESELGVPVVLENDGNAAAYGEFLHGAGKGLRSLAFIGLGTGIGGGLVLDGSLYRGRHDHAGEYGHLCVEKDGRRCACGNTGCLEAYASGTSIAAIAREAFAGTGRYDADALASLDCRAVEVLAKEGDPIALSIWDQVGRKLGLAVSALVQSLDPDLIVIGGGTSRALGLFYDTMVDSAKRQMFAVLANDLRISAARLGESAGAVGAAFLAAEAHDLWKREDHP